MARIAIFDSGVGGLTIYKEVHRRLSGHQFVFISDNESYPYGNKPEDYLIQRVEELSRRIVDYCTPDVFIVACNTASTIVLPSLRHSLEIPIVGVVPAIKPAANLSETKHIGILATPATIAREYTAELINDFASDCTLSMVGSSKMVELAEQKLRGKAPEFSVLEAELEPLLENKEIDVLVLACTHFPLLNKEIGHVFKVNKHKIVLIDSGRGIANRVTTIIADMDCPKNRVANASGGNTAVFTRTIETEAFFINQLDKLGLNYAGEL